MSGRQGVQAWPAEDAMQLSGSSCLSHCYDGICPLDRASAEACLEKGSFATDRHVEVKEFSAATHSVSSTEQQQQGQMVIPFYASSKNTGTISDANWTWQPQDGKQVPIVLPGNFLWWWWLLFILPHQCTQCFTEQTKQTGPCLKEDTICLSGVGRGEH